MTKPTTHDEYLEQYSDSTLQMMQSIRALIRSLVPEAEETISYGIPAFRLQGKYFVGYGGAKKHCALYPGAAILEKYKAELANYDTSKGTLRFNPDEPLPVDLLTQMITDLKLERLTTPKR